MARRHKDFPVVRILLLTLIVMASVLAPGRAPAEDMLIVVDGVRTGQVEGYAGGICTFDGAPVPRASIYFIGLDAELPVPMPQDAMRDEVHLRDGTVHAGPLVSIDADNVATESASFARKQVAWIWLTPMLGGQGQAAPSTRSRRMRPRTKSDRPTRGRASSQWRTGTTAKQAGIFGRPSTGSSCSKCQPMGRGRAGRSARHSQSV